MKKPQWSAEDVRRILTNPIYVGIGPYPQVIPEETWISVATRALAELGPEAYFKSMIENLRHAFAIDSEGDEA